MNKLIVGVFALVLPCVISIQADAKDRATKAASTSEVSKAATENSKTTQSTELRKAYFGAGCFWRVQYIFSNAKGVVKTTVGYSGGTLPNPTYEQVCGHTTKHVETVQVEYDPKKTTFKKLLEVFYNGHDPTTLNRQGPDVGDQYRSVIFYTDETQKEEALQYKKELEAKHRFKGPIVTAIEPAGKFYDAEDYHQDYFKKHGQRCM